MKHQQVSASMWELLEKKGFKNRTLLIFQSFPTYIEFLPDALEQEDYVLLQRRLEGESLETLSEELGYTKQAMQYREKKALTQFIHYLQSHQL